MCLRRFVASISFRVLPEEVSYPYLLMLCRYILLHVAPVLLYLSISPSACILGRDLWGLIFPTGMLEMTFIFHNKDLSVIIFVRPANHFCFSGAFPCFFFTISSFLSLSGVFQYNQNAKEALWKSLASITLPVLTSLRSAGPVSEQKANAENPRLPAFNNFI